jgi:hypothetical protein
LVVSALLVSYIPSSTGALTFSPALKHLVFFWIFSVLYAIGIKYLLSFMDEWHLLIWSSMGTMLAVLPLLAEKDIRDETRRILQRRARPNAAILLEDIFDFMGRLFSILAFALEPIVLVSAVCTIQPTVTLIYILALEPVRARHP